MFLYQRLFSYQHDQDKDGTDTVTGCDLKRFSDVLQANFQDAEYLSNSKVLETLYKATEAAIQTKMPGLLSGSAMEGGMFSALDVQGEDARGIDLDIMLEVGNHTFSETEEREHFHHVPGSPGFVMLDITNSEELKMKFPTVEKDGRVYISAAYYKEKIFNILQHHQTGNPLGLAVDRSFDVKTGKASVHVAIKEDMSWIHLIGVGFGLSPEKVMQLLCEAAAECLPNMQGEAGRKVVHEKIRKLHNAYRQINFDVVPCLPCRGWPTPLTDGFIKRDKTGLSKDIVDKILKEGHHLVAKASHDDSWEVEWRVSFSRAERTLMESRTDVQKKCFYMFKTLCKENVKSPHLTTYMLKTVMFWMCEIIPVDCWRKDNMAERIFGLFDKLIESVRSYSLSHYFITNSNILSNIATESLDELYEELLALRKTLPEIERPDDGMRFKSGKFANLILSILFKYVKYADGHTSLTNTDGHRQENAVVSNQPSQMSREDIRKACQEAKLGISLVAWLALWVCEDKKEIIDGRRATHRFIEKLHKESLGEDMAPGRSYLAWILGSFGLILLPIFLAYLYKIM